MDINITDAEREELKKRVLETVERRLTDELLESMRRTVTREALTNVYKKAHEKLGQLLMGKITDDMILAQVTRVLADMSKPEYGGNSAIQKAVERAIDRIIEVLGKSVGEEFKTVIWHALKHGAKPPPVPPEKLEGT